MALSRLRRASTALLPAFPVVAALAACAPGLDPERAPASRCCSAPTPDDWQRSAGEDGVTFSYPADLATTYIHTVDWPPDVAVHAGPYTCTEAGTATARAGRTEPVRVLDRQYCVTRIVEGAAGSIYTLYAWTIPRQDRVVILTFSIRAVQCGNYDEPARSECGQERRDFSIAPLMDRIAQTVRIDATAPPGR